MSVMCPNLYRKQHTNKKVLVRNIERLRLVWVLTETSFKAQNNGFVRLKFVLKATHTQQKFEASTPRRADDVAGECAAALAGAVGGKGGRAE